MSLFSGMIKLKGLVFKNASFNLLFIFFFLLRFYGIGVRDFWFDEMATVNDAIFQLSNWNAPLYGVLIHGWVKIFGFSHFAVRFPSLIFDFLALVVVYLLGKRLFDKKMAILAVAMMGLSPFHLWYAQEARDYSLALFLSVSSTFFLVRALDKAGVWPWVLFGLVSLAGLFTNYFYLIVFAMHLLVLIFVRKSRISWIEVGCFIGLAGCFSIYLPEFLKKFHYVANGFWLSKPSIWSLPITLENFILGYNSSYLLYFFADILIVVLLVFSFINGIGQRSFLKGIVFCFLLWALPVAGVFIFSKIFFSIYLDRGLILFSPFFYFSLSAGVLALPRIVRWCVFIIASVLYVAAIASFYQDRMPTTKEHHVGVWLKKPIRPAVNFLEMNMQPGDILAFTNDCVMPSWLFYQKNKTLQLYFFFDPDFLEPNSHRPFQRRRHVLPYDKIDTLEFNRLWVVFADYARAGKSEDYFVNVRAWLDKNLQVKSMHSMDGMWIVQYERAGQQ